MPPPPPHPPRRVWAISQYLTPPPHPPVPLKGVGNIPIPPPNNPPPIPPVPQKQIKRLQAVQNAAARTVMKCKKTDHITPILRQLHWLPIQKRIRHKILSATYRSVHDNTPLYLSDLLQKHNPSRLLRSASRSLLDVPGPRDSKTKRYGLRAFRYVAPSLWNVLPENIKEKDSIQSFRPSLKTHFFTQG